MMLVNRAAQALACAAMFTLVVQQAGAQLAPGPKVAYIRSQEIMAAAPGAQTAQVAFQHQLDSVGVIEKGFRDSLQTMIAEITKDDAKQTQAQKDALQKEFHDKQADFQARDSLMRIQLQQTQNSLLGPIMEQINEVIESIRAQDGYAIIFDAQAQGAGIVAADKNLDLTDRVIARLKVMGPPSGSTTASTTTPKKPGVGPTQNPSGISRKPSGN